MALAGCPAAAPGDGTPHFAAGGWLPYLEGIYERQWEQSVAPYWIALSEFARAEHPEVKICIELHPGTSVYNVETFRRLAALGENLAANIDPSHFFWMQMDALAVTSELSDRVGHVHAKDVWFNERVLATAGLLDHRWPGPTADVPWKFATVGRGHDARGGAPSWLSSTAPPRPPSPSSTRIPMSRPSRASPRRRTSSPEPWSARHERLLRRRALRGGVEAVR